MQHFLEMEAKDVKLLQKDHFEPGVYEEFLQKLKEMKINNNYICGDCKKKLANNAVFCDHCLLWVDWDCAGISKKHKGLW